MRPTHVLLILFIGSVALTICFDFIPFLREFNFDLPRMVEKVAKHPLAWINWKRIVIMTVIALVIWRRYYDGDAFKQPGLLPSAVVSLLFGVLAGWMLFLYLRERQKEQPGQSA